MNRYEIRIAGNLHPIQVRASRASVALARAVNRFTDSQFLNTPITIRYIGRVARVWRVRGYDPSESHWCITFASNLPTKAAAEREIEKLRASRPELTHLHVKSSVAEDRT